MVWASKSLTGVSLCLLVFCILQCNGVFNLYGQSHPLRKTTHLFNRLKHHEIVQFRHNQFHAVDSGEKAIYPMNGLLEFEAFGRVYTMRIRKNVELFSDSFRQEIHRWNESTQSLDRIVHGLEKPQCYYTAEVESDTESFMTTGVFSACRGKGIRGWIHAFGETIVIRPKRLLMDATYDGQHRIDDDHIVYRYQDLDRSDYPHHQGPVCGHDHPMTEQNLNETYERYKDSDPGMVEWIDVQRDFLKTHKLQHAHDHGDDGDEDEDEGHVFEANDIIAHPFQRSTFVEDARGRRRLQTYTKTRYVELAIVNDPGMLAAYNNLDTVLDKTVQIVATLQNYYLSADFGSTVGNIQIVLSAIFYIEDFDSSPLQKPVPYDQTLCGTGTSYTPNLYDGSPSGTYCEVAYSDYLSKFQTYRRTYLSNYDNAQLFSYYDFGSSVIGYASLPGMCINSASGGIEQCTYDEEYNGNIVAHEMGHNFNMKHDGSVGGNSCDQESYIMASVGSPYGTRPDSFSTCSVTYVQQFFDSSSYASALKCVDDKPTETSFAVCGNGFVEEGENCDCGATHCGSVDPCCDGSTCNLYASAQCSNDDDCCEDCQFKSAGTVCRELDTDNECDIEAETCTGDSSQCPPDFRHIEGTPCSDGDSSFGYCYDGNCKSIQQQCATRGAQIDEVFVVAPPTCSQYSPKWQIPSDKCGDRMLCRGVRDNSCVRITEQPDDGIPCNTSASVAVPSQCKEGTCVQSASALSYVWSVYSWQECNVTCKTNDDAAAGWQVREVVCTLQDGTQQADSLCDATSQPSSGRTCNDVVCNFCAPIGNDGGTVCDPNGECNQDLATCDCKSGFAGQFCDVAPGLNFTGITAMAYKNVTTGDTISLRANPPGCSGNASIQASFDQGSKTWTVPVDGVTTLTELYIGAMVYIRWRSGGDVNLLAVGMIEVDAEGEQVNADDWPFYVGSGLAADKSTCDTRNSTTFDPCYLELSCNDFAFRVPTDIPAGYYKLLVRFNNEFNVDSGVLTVRCSEDNCNSAGHGRCNADGTGCECDDGWFGDSCSESSCTDWSFAQCDRDENGNCGSLGTTEYKPKCFGADCDATVRNFSFVGDDGDELKNQCAYEESTYEPVASENGFNCDNPHFEGDYCEIPRDFCGKFLSESACEDSGVTRGSDADLCAWNANVAGGGRCVYQQCAGFLTETACEVNGRNDNDTANVTFYASNSTYAMFCEWIEVGATSYCNRVTCGDGVLPRCQNGAVRRPIYDSFYAAPQSICRLWYCDCATVDEVASSYWKVPTTAELLSGVAGDYDSSVAGAALTATNIEDAYLDLFTCGECGLQCANSAAVDDKCQNCDAGCPEEDDPFRSGRECSQVFWIGHFRLNIDWNVAFIDRWDEFEPLILTDLAHFLSTDTSHVSIWQLKPDGDRSKVFFRYLFDTNNEDEVQIVGGDAMYFASRELGDDTSTAARGFIMQYVDSSYGYQFCVPYKEECDPSKRLPVLEIFYICAGASFGLVLFAILLYRIGTRRRRQRAYESKVREVRQAQLRLMEHHGKARRVGMRDVSRRRASKIHNAQRVRDKEQKNEIKRRADEERKLNKIQEDQAASYQAMSDVGAGGGALDEDVAAPASSWGAPPAYAKSVGGDSHKKNESELELDQFRRHSMQAKPQYAASDNGRARGATYHNHNSASPSPFASPNTRPVSASVAHHSGGGGGAADRYGKRPSQAQSVASRSQSRARGNSAVDPAANLPPGWKCYYNNDRIPYFYNANTGQTTWRHPAQQQ
eukprot:CAMPEP_0202686732 /NCGR_PEP_ID=MMETSP1385-20130828/2498_1 /ASSEMBLY_ACC=CAM_ASM_000861 /TAXON_ID=933848 /ORGANISM="Elphidium margaritaceum" /LENGTH=1765 /DNA_ID=CAMNT_0049341379 /DNA_START=29 /DNA_END=5329 /DNA_ORIENTATION=+